MGNMIPSEYTIQRAILDAARYHGDIYVGDNFVMKAHKDYVEVNVDANNGKNHLSYNVYFDEKGNITKIEPHKNQ